MAFDKAEVKTGFYLGIGLLLAVLVWTVAQLFLARAVSKKNG